MLMLNTSEAFVRSNASVPSFVLDIPQPQLVEYLQQIVWSDHIVSKFSDTSDRFFQNALQNEKPGKIL